MKLGRFQIDLRRIAVFAGIGLLLVLVMQFNARVEELYRLKHQAATVGARATEVMRTQYNLQTAAAYATSDLAVEEWARQEGRMVQPGDVLVIPVPVGSATPPAQQYLPPSAVGTPLSNWDVWMLVIFGR
jgi:hypothetical protein